jgi:hypothetical protein
MYNPFEDIFQKLNEINERLKVIEEKSQLGPKHIPLPEFCKEKGITRPTAYAWEDRGLIKTELIGGRRFVLSESIIVESKYQRK